MRSTAKKQEIGQQEHDLVIGVTLYAFITIAASDAYSVTKVTLRVGILKLSLSLSLEAIIWRIPTSVVTYSNMHGDGVWRGVGSRV